MSAKENFKYIKGFGGGKPKPATTYPAYEDKEGLLYFDKSYSSLQIGTAKDLLSEGPIDGLVEGEYSYSGMIGNLGYGEVVYSEYPVAAKSATTVRFLRSIFWDGIPIVDSANNYNFQYVNVKYTLGNPGGGISQNIGFPTSSFTKSIGDTLRGISNEESARDWVRTYRVVDPHITSLAFNFKIQSLYVSLKYQDLSLTVPDLQSKISEDIIFANKSAANFTLIPVGRDPQPNTTAGANIVVGVGSIIFNSLELAILFTPLYEGFISKPTKNILSPPSLTKSLDANEEIKLDSSESLLNLTFKGKITEGYSRQVLITLPPDRDPAIIGWDISILKTTPEDVSRSKATSIFLESITENYSFDFLYPNSAILNSKFNSAFFSRIPERTFDVKLLKVKVPSNYNTLLRTYGVTTEMSSTEKVSDVTPGSARDDSLNFYFGTNNEFTVSGDLCPVSGGLIGRFDARFAVTGVGSALINSWPNSVVNATTNPGCLDLQCTIGNATHTLIAPSVPSLNRPSKNSYAPNGLTGINFSATNMKVRFSNFANAPASETIALDALSGYSVFAVCKWNNAAAYANRREILEGYNNTADTWKLGFNDACGNKYFQFGLYKNTSPIWGSYNQLNIGLSATAASLDDSMYVVGVTSKTNLTTMYWQNEKYTVKYTATLPLGLSINETPKSICSLFELLIYKKSLTDIESRAVVSWLQKKWCTNYIGLTNANIVADKGLLGDGHFCLKTDGCSLSIPIKTHAYDGAMTKNSKVAGSTASTDFNGTPVGERPRSSTGPFDTANEYSELARSNHLIDHQDFFYKGFNGSFDWFIGDHGHCSFYCSFHLKLIDASVVDDTEYNLIHRQGQFSLSFKTSKLSTTGTPTPLAMVHLILRIFTPTGVRTVIKETKYNKSEFFNSYKKIIFHIIPRIIKTDLKYTEPTNLAKFGVYSLINTISFQNDSLYSSPISVYPFVGSKADLKTAIWMQNGVELKDRLYIYDYFPTILGSQINVLINDDTEIQVSLNPGNYLSYKDYMGNVEQVPGGRITVPVTYSHAKISNWRFFRSVDSNQHVNIKNINKDADYLTSLIAPPCLNIITGVADNVWNFGGASADAYTGASLVKYPKLNPTLAPLFLTWRNGYQDYAYAYSEIYDQYLTSFYGEGNFTAPEIAKMKIDYPKYNIDSTITSISDALQNNPIKISNIDTLYGKPVFSKGQQALNRFNNLAEDGILATTPVNTDIKNLNSDGLTVNLSNLQKEVVMTISSADMYPRSKTDNTNSACNRTNTNRELFTSFSPYNYIFCTGNLEVFSDKETPGYGSKLVAFIDELTVDTINFSKLELASINNNIYFNKSLTASKKTTYTTTPSAYTASNDLWDGTFKDDKEWTNNPAWCFYDLLTNKRYGAGNYIKESDVDKWSLYRVAKYCDELVSDGAGGVEPRFTCNTYITSQEDALKVLGDMASIFRGMFYYANGLISTINDMPSETSIYTFTNANVVGGDFSYESSSLKDRNSAVYVRYIDKTKSHKPGVEYVENVEAIRKFGLKETELTAFGCTSRGQAQRLGRWLLSSDYNETETITFQTGPEAVYLKPGDVVKVYDYNKKYKTVGGRLNSIVLSGVDNTSAFGAMTGFFGLDRKLDFDFSSQKVYKFSILAPKMNLDPSVNGAVLSSRDISEYRNPLVSSTFISGSNLITGANYDTIKISGLTSMLTGFNQFNITGLRLFTGATGMSPASLVWSLENSGSLDGATDSDYDFYRLFRIQEGQNSEYTLLGAQVYNLKYTQIENGLNIVSFSTNPQALSPDSASFEVIGNNIVLTINYAGSQKSVNSNFKVFKKSNFTNFNPATDLNFTTVNINRTTNSVTTTIPITSADAGASFRVYGNNSFNLISINFIQPTDSKNDAALPGVNITKIILSTSKLLSTPAGSSLAAADPISLKRTNFNSSLDFAFTTSLDAFSMDVSSIISNDLDFRTVIIPEKVSNKAAFKTAYEKYNTNLVFQKYCSEEFSSSDSFTYGTVSHLSKFRNFSIGIDLSKDNNTINSSNDFEIPGNFILITYDNEDAPLLTNLTNFADGFHTLKLTTAADPNETVVNYLPNIELNAYMKKVYLLLLPSDSSFGFDNTSGLEKRVNYSSSSPRSISIAKYDRFAVQTAELIDSTSVILKAGSQTISVDDFITFEGDFTEYKITNISLAGDIRTLTIEPGLKFALAINKLVTILTDHFANWTEILDSHFIDLNFASATEISTTLDLNNRPFKLTKYRMYFIGVDKFMPTPTNPLDHTSKYLNSLSPPIESRVYPFIYSPNKLLTTLTFGAYDAEILLNNLGSNYLHFTLNKTSIISYTRPLETANDNFTTGYNNITLGYLVTKPTSGVNISSQGGSLGGLDKTLLNGNDSTVGQKVSGYQLCIASRPTLPSMGPLAIPENNKRSFLLNGNKIFTNALRVNDTNDSVYGISTAKLATVTEAGNEGIPSYLNTSFATANADNSYTATSSNLYFMKSGNDDSAFFGDNGKELFDLNIAHVTNFSGTTSNAQDPNSLYSKVTGQGFVTVSATNKVSTNQVSGSYKSSAISATSISLYASMSTATNPFGTNILLNSAVFSKPFNILDVTPISNKNNNLLGTITNSCGVLVPVFPSNDLRIITKAEFNFLNPSTDTVANGWNAITAAAGVAATSARTHYFGIPYISSLLTFNFTITIASVTIAKKIALYCFYGDLEISNDCSFKIGNGSPTIGGGRTAALSVNTAPQSIIVTIPALTPNNYYTYSNNNNIDSPIGRLSADFPNYWFYKFKEPKSLSFAHVMALGKGPAAGVATMNYANGQYTMPRNNHYIQAFELSIIIAILP